MKVYTQTLEVPDYLCDRDDQLHTWAAIRLCQEVSELHSKATGIGYEAMREQNRIWIISRAYYIIYRRAKAFEKVMLSTWSRGNDGLFAFRDYRMESEAGETMLVGTTYWPLIDFATHKPVRLNDTLDGYDYESRAATARNTLDRLRLPDGRMDTTANYSIYVKLVFDSLMQTGYNLDSPYSLELNYNHETAPGDTLSVLRKQHDGAEWFQITNSRGLSVTAKVSVL